MPKINSINKNCFVNIVINERIIAAEMITSFKFRKFKDTANTT